MLEEALEDRESQPLADAGQAGVIRQRLIQSVAEIPTVRKVQARRIDQVALRAQALEEQDELKFEEHDRVDGRPAPGLVERLDPLSDEAEIQVRVEVAVEVVGRNELFERNHYGLVNRADLRGPEHR